MSKPLLISVLLLLLHPRAHLPTSHAAAGVGDQREPLARTFVPGTFSMQRNLTKLMLNYNRLKTVLPGMFASLKQLDTLQMKGNIISHLPPLVFGNMSNLRVLDLSLNKLEVVTGQTFSGLDRLEILKLNHNLMRNLSLDLFSDMATLKELHLEGNKISQLSENCFMNLTNLEVLNLRGNLLKMFSGHVFGSSSKLRELNLKGNHLSEIGHLGNLSSLTKLYLSYNRLQTLPEGLMDTFSNDHVLQLHSNPWKCDCGLWYLHDWVLRNGQNVEMLERTLCESPGFLNRRTLDSVDKEQLVCRVAKEHSVDVRNCLLQVIGDAVMIKCKVETCLPLTVKVQLQDESGNVKEHVVRNEGTNSTNVA
uniref:LRRCT domain-containing protein n=1 Tax=Neogobius melanostomus TaxID=47308 RepID=A0A8C6UUU3_9GOBI